MYIYKQLMLYIMHLIFFYFVILFLFQFRVFKKFFYTIFVFMIFCINCKCFPIDSSWFFCCLSGLYNIFFIYFFNFDMICPIRRNNHKKYIQIPRIFWWLRAKHIFYFVYDCYLSFKKFRFENAQSSSLF